MEADSISMVHVMHATLKWMSVEKQCCSQGSGLN